MLIRQSERSNVAQAVPKVKTCLPIHVPPAHAEPNGHPQYAAPRPTS